MGALGPEQKKEPTHKVIHHMHVRAQDFPLFVWTKLAQWILPGYPVSLAKDWAFMLTAKYSLANSHQLLNLSFGDADQYKSWNGRTGGNIPDHSLILD